MDTLSSTLEPPREAPSTDRLVLMLFLATAFHALVILGIGFDAFDLPPERDTPTLDITVVNPTKSPPPEDYDYLAESSQDGAGNTEEKVRPREQLIEQAPPVQRSERKPAATQILSSDNSRQKTALKTEPQPEQDSEQTEAAELINRSMEMLTLNQQINQSLQAYSRTKNRSKFISSRTREFKYASYMRDWVQKVERVGELNYPDSARRQNLSGKLIVQVALYPDGTVREITIRKPSGHKILDDAAVRIVKLAAPFAPFPEDIKKETDVLYITRTWVFTSGNRLQSH